MNPELYRIRATLAQCGWAGLWHRTATFLKVMFRLVVLGRGSAMLHPDERDHLAGIAQARRPRVVLEIGTAYGGSLQTWCESCPHDATIISVDLPGGLLFGGGDPGCPFWTRFFFRRFARHGQKLRFVRGDSKSPETLAAVERILDGRQIDLLFIDGDHSYEGTRADYRNYLPFMGDGGMVVFHDVNPNGNLGSSRFWADLTRLEPYAITVNYHPETFGLGLGLLAL